MIDMGRREFISLIGGASASVGAWSLAARAQQGVRRVAVLSSIGESDQEAQLMVAGLHDGLQALGWVNGRNLRIDHRWAAGSSDRVVVLAKELVALSPDVIVAHTTPSGLALQRATDTIPIVFVQVSDPEGSGLVANIAHPGANITGFTSFEASMAGKWLEMLREMAPGIARAAILFNPDTASYVGRYYQAPFQAAASALGVTALTYPVRNARELEGMIGELAGAAGAALIVMPDSFNIVHRDRIIELTARYRIPSISPYRFAVKEGSLMSYGIDFVDLFRRTAVYVDRILKGKKPGELPVQAPTKFELVINLHTAKTLGLTVPPTLLARADEVIE
jgi:putative ABC transport system substrate-binding protein